MNAYQQLLKKLDAFINRYYLNQVIRGLLLVSTLLLASYLLVAGTAFYVHLSSGARAVLFYLFIGTNAWVLVRWVIAPAMRYKSLLKRMTYKDAAVLIGSSMPEVRDKLLNTIELSDYSLNDGTSPELLMASIEQRTWQLQPLPFLKLIDLGKNRAYLKYLLPVAATFIVVLFTAPSVITKGGEQVIKYNRAFEPRRPFDFLFDGKELVVEEGSDVLIQMSTAGKELPKEAKIELSGFTYRMDVISQGRFSYTLRNVQKTDRIRFVANKFYSDWYKLKVVPRPIIDRFEVVLNYPAYLNRPNERLANTGDLVVPAGTKIEWQFGSKGVDSLVLILGNRRLVGTENQRSTFSVVYKATEPQAYQVITSNGLNPKGDTMSFALQVIPDAWPTIEVGESFDSTNQRLRYFSGDIGDDYGFTKLDFVYEITDNHGKPLGTTKRIQLPLVNGVRQRFFHYFDTRIQDLPDGALLSYYFEVWDNDGVQGPKKVRSNAFTFKSLTQEERELAIDQNTNEVQKNLQGAVNDAKQLQKELEKLRRRLKEGKELSWEDKQALEQLKRKQENLKDKVQDAADKMKENENLCDKGPKEEELLNKQQKLQEMAEKLLTDDIKKMMEELQRMMEQQSNKDQLQQKLDEMKVDQRDVEKELDRMLEFFKGLEVEQRAMEVANELEKLGNKQEELKNSNVPLSDQAEKQDELNKAFDEVQKDIKELEKLNDALEKPNDLGNLDNESKDIKNELKQASDELSKGQKPKAKKSQQQAAQQMKKMAQRMRDQMQQQEMQMLQENIQALRMLLENLVKFSFSQEALMDRLQENSNYSPVYVEIGKEQSKLREEAKLIEDSLTALSKRIMQLEQTITKEMSQVNDNLQKAVEGLGSRQTAQAKTRQQYAMTSVNNLAVLLAELLKNMQEEMAKQMEGDQQCQKPGGASPSKMSKMSQMQQSLNQQMQQMKDKMQGQKGKESGGKQGRNGEMSQGFAEMVAKQEAIRRELQRMSQEMGKDGKDGLGSELEKLAKEMEKTERELVNKTLTSESLRRQEEIMTRLLEAEKSDREREYDDKRESNSAKDIPRQTPPGFDTFKRQQQKSLEMLKGSTPELNTYYRKKVDRYFLQLNP